MKIAIPLYDRFTALDAVGPYEVLQRLPGAEITWLAHKPGLVGTDTGQLHLHADAAFEELPDPDIIRGRSTCRSARGRRRCGARMRPCASPSHSLCW